MNYSDNCSLFFSFVTVPLGKEVEFYENEIEAIIKGYSKKKQEDSESFGHNPISEGKKNAFNDFKKYLYKPRAYYLFGDYDLAVIALIDDYTLTNRNFHPYSYFISEKNKDRYYSEKFNYQIFTGTTPVITRELRDKPIEGAVFNSKLIKIAKKTFIYNDTKQKKFPFIGFTRLKVNNSLLIGAGAKFVSLIEIAIKDILIKNSNTDELSFIISESFSWHELSIVFFSNSFQKIIEAILRIRELRLSNLKEYSENLFDGYKKNEDFDYFKAIVDNCLLKHVINNESQKFKVEEAHVFVKTLTTFGIDFDFFNESKLKADEKDLDFPPDFHKPNLRTEDLEFFINWDIKPGHLLEIVKEFKEHLGDVENIEITSGRTDFLFPGMKDKRDLKSILIILKKLVQLPLKGKDKKITQHLRKLNTVVKFSFDEPFISDITNSIFSSEHYYFSNKLSKFSFSLKQLSKIRKNLYRCNVSKVLLEKILNMYVNYNDGIQDPLLYIYFIELRQFLEYVIEKIQNYTSEENENLEEASNSIHDTLDKLADLFELAFKNRFHQSYRMDGVTDFNMEHNGGCQQIISALDGAYKVISSIFGENDEPTSMVIVTGLSGVDSSYYCMRINYFHIFQPSIFIAPSIKESVNQFFSKIKLLVGANITDKIRYKKLQDTKSLIKLLKAKLNRYLNENPLMHEYNEYLDESMLKYFRSDIISYMYAYNFDTKLFRFWYWNYFMQMSSVYDKKGKIDEGIFLRFFMRYLLIIEFFDPMFEDQNYNIYTGEGIPSIKISSLWTLHFFRLRKFIKSLLQDEGNQLKSWLYDSTSIAFSLVVNDVIGNDHVDYDSIKRDKMMGDFVKLEYEIISNSKKADKKLIDDLSSTEENAIRNKIEKVYSERKKSEDKTLERLKKFSNLPKEESSYFRSLSAQLTSFKFDEINETSTSSELLAGNAIIERYFSIFRRVNYIKNKFRIGEVYAYNNKYKLKSESRSPSLYLQTISYSYLKLLMEDLIDTQKETLLMRNEFNHSDNNKIANDKFYSIKDFDLNVKRKYNGPLVFDPLGGLFSTDMYTRRKYFKYRSTLIRSFWDMSLKVKKDLFVKLLP